MKLKTPRHFIKDSNDEIAYVEERFILDITHALAVAVDAKDSRKSVAAEIGMRPQQLSDLLSGEANMTLRTLARVAYAVDLFPQVALAPLTALDGGPVPAFGTIMIEVMSSPWLTAGRFASIRPFVLEGRPAVKVFSFLEQPIADEHRFPLTIRVVPPGRRSPEERAESCKTPTGVGSAA